MDYIILDLEWNQIYGKKVRINNSLLLNGEIIQIGAVKVNSDGELIDSLKLGVKPKYYKKIHKSVLKLTGITNEDFKVGLPFGSAYSHFKKWCGEEFILLTWGSDDIGILEENILIHKLDKLNYTHYDLQIIFDNQISQLYRQVSLDKAVAMVGAEKRQSHDAYYDVLSTYDVFTKLDIQSGISDYIALKDRFNAGDCISSEVYTFSEDVDSEPKEVWFHKFMCPVCNKEHSCGKWIKQNSAKYIALGKCNISGEKYIIETRRKVKQSSTTIRKTVYSYESHGENYEKVILKQAEKHKSRNMDKKSVPSTQL